MLENSATLDCVVLSIGLTEEEDIRIKKEIPCVELLDSSTVIVLADIPNIRYSIYYRKVSGKIVARLAAKCYLSHGKFSMGRRESREPFLKLARKLSVGEGLAKREVSWNRLVFNTYTPEIPEDVDLLAWLVKAYEPTFQAQGNTITRSAAAAVKTKFTKFSKGSRVSGVRWVRTSGEHTLYTITVYRKDSAVAKRAAQAESSKMGDFEKKVALNNAKLVSSVGNRLRVELI